MAWHLKQDTLFSKTGKEIGYFLPTATDKEKEMIKNTDELVDLVGEFVVDYDIGKTPLKKLYSLLKNIVDVKTNYQITWKETPEGELINEDGNLILFFVQPNSIFSNIIRHIPEVYSCSQDLLNNLSSTNRHEMKKLYNRICNFYNKLD